MDDKFEVVFNDDGIESSEPGHNETQFFTSEKEAGNDPL